MATILSAAILRRIATLFPEPDRAYVADWLARECGDRLPGGASMTAESQERIRSAVLKISAGDLGRLTLAVEQAQQDWRDSLVAAGFGWDVDAHHRWLAEV